MEVAMKAAREAAKRKPVLVVVLPACMPSTKA